MRNRLFLSSWLLACLCAAWLGYSTNAAPQVLGPCQNWQCAGGPYSGYWNSVTPCGNPPDTNSCSIFANSVPACQNQNGACNPQARGSYLCRGAEGGGRDCC